MSHYPGEIDRESSQLVAFGDVDLARVDPVRAGGEQPRRPPGGFAHELASVDCPEARQRLLRTALRAAGFETLCYIRATRIGETFRRLAYYQTYSPAGWAARYLRERFFDVDARLAFSSRNEWPLLWDLQSIALAPPSTAAADAPSASATAQQPAKRFAHAERLRAAAHAAGMLSGVSFGLASPNAFDTAIVLFASSRPSRERILDTAVGHAYAIAVGLHEFLLARAVHLHRPEHANHLSPTHRKILELLTLGLNDKDISERLATSPHNVDYYLRQLKKMYHAVNRVQLAYIAGRVL